VLVVPSLRVYILQLGEFVNLVHPHRTLVIDTDIAGLPLFSGDDHYTVGAAQAIERRSRATAKDVHRLDVVRIDVYSTVTHAADGCRLSLGGRAVVHDYPIDDKQWRIVAVRIE